MKPDCIFCKLANGTIPVEHVLTNEHAVMIKDKNPIAPHHLLVMPKKHYGDIGDLLLMAGDLRNSLEVRTESEEDKNVLAAMFGLVDDYVSLYMLNARGGYRLVTNVGPDAGQTVTHLHFHLLGGAKLKNDFGA